MAKVILPKDLIDVINVIFLIPRNINAPMIPITTNVLGLAYHHAAAETDAIGIATYHVKTQAWDHIGYHFVIENDGIIKQTLDLNEKGFHAAYTRGDLLHEFPNQDKQFYNNSYLAVCLTGDLTKHDPTPAQIESCIKLGVAVKRATSNLILLKGHKELPGKQTSCPGSLNMRMIRNEVDKRLGVLDAPMASPGPGDDVFWQKFPNWREGAISVKGSADFFGSELEKAKGHIDNMIVSQELTLKQLKMLQARLKEITT